MDWSTFYMVPTTQGIFLGRRYLRKLTGIFEWSITLYYCENSDRLWHPDNYLWFWNSANSVQRRSFHWLQTFRSSQHRSKIWIWVWIVVYHIPVFESQCNRLRWYWNAAYRTRVLAWSMVRIPSFLIDGLSILCPSRLHTKVITVTFSLTNNGTVAGHEVNHPVRSMQCQCVNRQC